MVAGATGIDLFLLVIDAAEGARPQTLEHIAILRLLGVERRRRRNHQGRPGRRGDARDRDRRGARARPGGGGRRRQRQDRDGSRRSASGARARGRPLDGARRGRAGAPLRRPGVHAARHRHRRHRHALVGHDRRGRRAPGRSRRRRGASSLGAGARRRRRAGDRRRAGCARSARRRPARRCTAATRSSRPAPFRSPTASTSSSRSSCRSTAARASRCITAPRAFRPASPGSARGRRSCGSRLPSSRRVATASSSAVRRPSVAPPCSILPRHDGSTRSGSSCSSVATRRRSCRRPSTRRSRSSRLRSRGLLAPAELEEGLAAVVQAERLGVLADVARGDARRRSSSACAPAPRRSRSSRGSRSPSSCRPSPGRRRSCRSCRSSGAAGWHTSPASRPRSVRAQQQPRSSTGELDGAGLGGGEGRRPRARAVPRRRRPARAARRRLRRLGGRLRARARARGRRVHVPRVRSRSPASAISQAWVVAMRSSCSSGSTRTGSRDGSATAACCDGRRANRQVSSTGPGSARPGCRSHGAVGPLGLVVDTDRVRDAVDVVEVADHLDRIVDRSVVPAVRPERVRVLEPDRGGRCASA